MTQSLYNQLRNSPAGMGQMLFRDILLADLLGDEAKGILYWSGKDIARKLPVATDEDLITLFHQLGLGELQLEKKNANQQVWKLSGPEVVDRIQLDNVSFNFEAGLIAQQIEYQTNAVTEASVEVEKKKFVQIIAYHDLTNKVTDESVVDFIKLSE